MMNLNPAVSCHFDVKSYLLALAVMSIDLFRVPCFSRPAGMISGFEIPDAIVAERLGADKSDKDVVVCLVVKNNMPRSPWEKSWFPSSGRR